MLLDPCLYKVVVGGEHEKGIAHGLGNEPREKGGNLGGVDILVAFDLGANARPLFVERLAIHTSSFRRRFLPWFSAFRAILANWQGLGLRDPVRSDGRKG